MPPGSEIHEFSSVHGECPEIPDDLTLPQFLLDKSHPLRPTRPAGSPWVIDDESGKTLDYEQVRACVIADSPSYRTHPSLRSDRGVTHLRKLSGRNGV